MRRTRDYDQPGRIMYDLLSETLRELRLHADVTLGEIADAAGIPTGTASSRCRPAVDPLSWPRIVADALGYDVEVHLVPRDGGPPLKVTTETLAELRERRLWGDPSPYTLTGVQSV